MSVAPALSPLAALALAQLLAGGRVARRCLRGIGARPIAAAARQSEPDGCVSVVVPVLNERGRLGPCLEGLMAQGPEVGEILVVDGGSTDGTRALVAAYAARDTRLRPLDGAAMPPGWNGKAWNLEVGQRSSRDAAAWVLTVDADVRPAPLLVRSLLARARGAEVDALSAATRQRLSGPAEALVHPALLTTLVYRLGSPGYATVRPTAVQANGQCFLARRDVLLATKAIAAARDSRAEDVTMARHLAACGYRVGFYEGGDLAAVEMYASAGEAWRNWPRSLPLRDQYAGAWWAVGLAEVTLAQALPLPLLAVLLVWRAGDTPWRFAVCVNALLLAVRLGVLAGTARAYVSVPWSYWLSPLLDAPAALALWFSALRRTHRWRGRLLVRGGPA